MDSECHFSNTTTVRRTRYIVLPVRRAVRTSVVSAGGFTFEILIAGRILFLLVKLKYEYRLRKQKKKERIPGGVINACTSRTRR